MGSIFYKDSGSQFDSWDDFVKYNKTLPCSNPRCNRLRHERSKWCMSCYQYASAFGDPELRSIRPKTFRVEVKGVLNLLDFNYGHPLVVDFIDKIVKICEDSEAGLPVEFGKYFKCIDFLFKHNNELRKKRKPLDILVDWTAFYIFHKKTYNEYVKTDEQYYYMLADIPLYYVKAKLATHPTGLRMRKFGKACEEMFGIYWINLGNAVLQNEREEKARLETLNNAEFKLPVDRYEI